MIATYAATREILARYGHKARKRLGQHFLTDPHVLGKIMKCAHVCPQDAVLEIGPGIGGLTQALAEAAGQVCAVELDKSLAAILRNIFAAQPNVEVVQSDIMDYDIAAYMARFAQLRHKVVANLPYGVTTPVLMHILENFRFASATVMVQREVAERITGKDHGALTLAVQYRADAHIAAYVPENCFFPRPAVGSAVVHLHILNKPRVDVPPGRLFPLIRAGFAQRRKTLVNSLFSAEVTGLTKAEIAEKIVACGLRENIRGEALSLSEWARLAVCLQ